jgi:hypothetical protein
MAGVQVSNIDITKESPCGHGTVICFSVYCGEDVHFGETVDGQPADGIVQSQLWVDTMVDDAKDQVRLLSIDRLVCLKKACTCHAGWVSSMAELFAADNKHGAPLMSIVNSMAHGRCHFNVRVIIIWMCDFS